MQLRMLPDAEAWRLKVIGRIPVRKRFGVAGWVTVDGEDLNHLKVRSWWLSSDGYAIRSTGGRKNKRNVRMHREIMGMVDGSTKLFVDHINRNRLDNRRENLRALTSSQSAQNVSGRNRTSAFQGVCWNKRRKCWTAFSSVKGKTIYLGGFDSEEAAYEAASAWRAANLPYSLDAAKVVA